MECHEARAALWPPERPRLVAEDVAEARAHVERCEACTEYFGQDRALLDVYERAREVTAPADVRERVFDALAEARRDPGASEQRSESRLAGLTTRFRGWPAALVAVLALVMLVELLPTAEQQGEDPDVFVQDYLRRAVGQDHIQTDDPTEVTRFLQRELGLRISPLDYAGLLVEGAEICLLEGRRGAMIVYKKDGAEVSHYLIPRDDATLREPALSSAGDPHRMREMPVVTWATPRLEQALVGEVDADQLLSIASRGASDD